MSATTNVSGRSLRAAGYLAIIYGLFGALSGLAGAGTFLPFQSASTYSAGMAGPLTAIAAAGAAISGFGVVAGWALLHSKTWGWTAAMLSALASVGAVGAMAAVWPESSSFLVVAAVAYALEIVLLLIGRGRGSAMVSGLSTA